MQITSTPAIAANAAQSNADLLAESTNYTANVGGKTFTADLNLSAGQYVARASIYLTHQGKGARAAKSVQLIIL